MISLILFRKLPDHLIYTAMKNYLMIAFLLMASIGWAVEPKETDKASVEASIKGFYNALENLDFEKLKTFSAPDFSGFENNGYVKSIDDFIAIVKSFDCNSIQIKMDFVKTDVAQNLANSIVKFEGQFKNAKSEMNLKSFENYILKKINGKWLISFFHSSYLNSPRNLQSGNILGLHVLDNIELKPGVTMEQVEEFFNKKFIPAFNEGSDQIKVVLLKGVRGDAQDQLAVIMHMGSDDIRNSLWSSDGTLSPKGEEYFKRFEKLFEEGDKLYITKKDSYTDWEIK
jgi:hypothetical protein